jgi:ligand-binding sensor domain-containing protein
MVYSKMKWLAILFALLTFSQLLGQDNPVALGEWRSHLSYEKMVAVTESDDAVFYASTQAILKVYKEDQSLEHLNKVSGLSDMRIKTIEYNLSENILVIAYINGNIDLLHDNGYVENLSAIMTNSNIIGDKSINHIYTSGKKIYFSCSFGLVVYDLNIDAFSQTTFTPSDVNACTQYGDTLFMATNQGIYKGVMDGRNLLDFGTWRFQGSNTGLNIASYSSRNLIGFNNKVYAAAADTLYQYYDGSWHHVSGYDNAAGQAISVWKPTGTGDFVPNYNMSLNYNQDQLIIATNTSRYYLIDAGNTIETKDHGGAWRIKDIVIDQENIHWSADEGYIHRNFQPIKPNAPKTNTVADMHVDEDGTLWVAASPYNGIRAEFNKDGFFSYKEGYWKEYSYRTNAITDTFWDPIRIISNPVNNKIYVGSFMSGLLEMDADDNVLTFDQYTPGVPLVGTNGDKARTRIQGLAVDDDGNVWMTNSSTFDATLTVKKRNGDWLAFPSTFFQNQIQVEDLVIDRNGYKWVKHITGKVTVFDSGDLEDDSDNRSIQLGDNNTVLPSNAVKCLAADKNGAVWVGTNAGITIFNCSSNVFDGACSGNRPVISQDDFNGYLLEGETVVDIAVDAANRKWVATTNGLFLLSEDGYDQLAYFTKENSPLFDNEVNHLAIDGVTGTVYIATLSGIQSFRGEATTGQKRMKSNDIVVFPHPVDPGYTGPIAISNLVDEANVKITDVSGRLVYETTALGGQAIWNGTDYTGRRAKSGVYLVFVVNEDGGQKGVGKILFLN